MKEKSKQLFYEILKKKRIDPKGGFDKEILERLLDYLSDKNNYSAYFDFSLEDVHEVIEKIDSDCLRFWIILICCNDLKRWMGSSSINLSPNKIEPLTIGETFVIVKGTLDIWKEKYEGTFAAKKFSNLCDFMIHDVFRKEIKKLGIF